MLEHALYSLGAESVNQERRFAEEFCAIAYFRVPEFRKILLSLIERSDDPKIKEWRGTDFSLSDDNTTFKSYLPGENTF